ncbi:hypothetical protein [Halomarina rubra]|uniref:Uncharacterized protein n=1 Tax=Halomarina rubra TaxID=2071873 RepID=A0ABD6AQW7_9EURY|nr:hypothetical protein [Halomarina rubra]
MTTDTRKLGLGAALLLLSTVAVLLVAAGDIYANTPVLDAVGGIASLAMAAGALLVGLSEQGSGV